jgi:RNase P/RNase MRP subunit p30
MKTEKEVVIISERNLEKARKKIDKEHKTNKEIYVLSREIEFNRKILENKKVSGLIMRHPDLKQKIKERNSGLNHVLCAIAKKNNTKIIFDLNELNSKDKLEKAKIIEKIIQNIKLCRKSKVNFYWTNFNANEKENLFALSLCLGCDTKTAKEAVI